MYSEMLWILDESTVGPPMMCCCWTVLTLKDISASHTAWSGRGWGCTRSWKGTEPEQLTQTAQYCIPFYMASCWTEPQSWGKEGGRRDVCGDDICLPEKMLHMLSAAVLAVAEHLLVDGKKPTNSLQCFACSQGFCFTLWAVFISAQGFLHGYLPDSILHPAWGQWASSRVVLSCPPGLQHIFPAVLRAVCNPQHNVLIFKISDLTETLKQDRAKQLNSFPVKDQRSIFLTVIISASNAFISLRFF